MKERDYQAKLIDKIKSEFPGAIVLKNDSGYLQGIPDLAVFYRDKWAMLEVKATKSSSQQPNQEYYVDKFDEMSYATFIYPENEKEVFRDLQHTFGY